MPSTNSPNAIREATSSSVSALALNYKPAEDALHRWQGKFAGNAVLHKDELRHLHSLQVKAALAAGRAACSVMQVVSSMCAYTSPMCTCAGLVPSMCSCCSVCTYNPESAFRHFAGVLRVLDGIAAWLQNAEHYLDVRTSGHTETCKKITI